jgi:class I fructose-bisphosphate aldolase
LPTSQPKTQAITGSVDDALRLGCAAIGFTIYPGSSLSLEMFGDIAEMRREAAMAGLATIIWSYPRGEDLDSKAETAIDVTAYAAHIAALLGAHVIKVKLSTDHVSQPEARKVYESRKIDVATGAARVRHVVQACLGGRRLVVFSGGAAKGDEAVLEDTHAIRDGGGNGSIIGRNAFQRPRARPSRSSTAWCRSTRGSRRATGRRRSAGPPRARWSRRREPCHPRPKRRHGRRGRHR